LEGAPEEKEQIRVWMIPLTRWMIPIGSLSVHHYPASLIGLPRLWARMMGLRYLVPRQLMDHHKRFYYSIELKSHRGRFENEQIRNGLDLYNGQCHLGQPPALPCTSFKLSDP
jgi:hypothetical protein